MQTRRLVGSASWLENSRLGPFRLTPQASGFSCNSSCSASQRIGRKSLISCVFPHPQGPRAWQGHAVVVEVLIALEV